MQDLRLVGASPSCDFSRQTSYLQIDLKQLIIDELTVLQDAEKASKNVFKARAYTKVINGIKLLPFVKSLGDLKSVEGIGEKIHAKIAEIIKTGSLHQADKIRKSEHFGSVSELSKVYGIGPSKAQECIENDIFTVDQLRAYVESNPDFCTENQKKGLLYYDDFLCRIPFAEMLEHEKYIKQVCSKVNPAAKVELVGSFRRKQASSGDIDVLICNNTDMSDKNLLEDIVAELEHANFVIDSLALGQKKYMGVCKVAQKARRLDILVTPPTQWPFALAYFTGSQDFNIKMRAKALSLGWSLNEHGLTPNLKSTNKKPKSTDELSSDRSKPIINILTEKDLFAFLDIPYTLPENR